MVVQLIARVRMSMVLSECMVQGTGKWEGEEIMGVGRQHSSVVTG